MGWFHWSEVIFIVCKQREKGKVYGNFCLFEKLLIFSHVKHCHVNAAVRSFTLLRFALDCVLCSCLCAFQSVSSVFKYSLIVFTCYAMCLIGQMWRVFGARNVSIKAFDCCHCADRVFLNFISTLQRASVQFSKI